MKNEILVAVDGSVYSNQSLRYLVALFGSREDFHFYLCTWISATPSIMPSVADEKNSLIPGSGKQNKKEAAAVRYMKKASDRLIRAGIAPERIHSSIELSGYNIAGAIQQKAERKLPDAILVGRRGLDGISEMLMGSVSAALFKKSHTIPLWIIDGEVQSKNFLVPVDGSPNTLMAIDHLSHICKDRDDLVFHLFHCSALFRKKEPFRPELFYHSWEKEWCDCHLSREDALFHGPSQLLKEAGIPESQIQILPKKLDLEEAHGIISEAKKQNCGTIVIGRRKAGIGKGLFGGVSDRTVKNVQNLAIWIVG